MEWTVGEKGFVVGLQVITSPAIFLFYQVVKCVRMADTPSRLEGAESEIGNRIWVDHKAGYFVLY